MKSRMIATAIAAIALTAASSASFAADKMMGGKMMGGKMMHGKMMGGKMMHGKMVAYCAKCKMYYSAADGKKMHMMDTMGHKMMMMPMAKVPKGAKMMHGGMMNGKM